MYWFVFLLLLVFSIVEIKNKSISVIAFRFSYMLLTLMILLRKGQGTDYYNYRDIFNGIDIITRNSILPLFLEKDFGYAFLNYIAIKCGISYEFFIALCSLLVMLILYRFFDKICHRSVLVLYLFYATFFLIYPFNAIRQGLALAILLGYVYPFLCKGDYLKGFISIIVGSLFHQSFLICLLFLFVYKVRYSTKCLLFIALPFIFNLLLGINVVQYIPIPFIIERIISYSENEISSPFLSIIVRIIALIPIFLIPRDIYDKDDELRGVRNLMFCGFIVYSLFSFSDLVSSRLAAYFRVFEGLFLFRIIFYTKLKTINYQLAAYYITISAVLFTKDIAGFIDQGSYVHCNVLTYPYLNIFDDDNTILYYRQNLGFSDRIE